MTDNLSATFRYKEFNVSVTMTDENTTISYEHIKYPSARLVMVEPANAVGIGMISHMMELGNVVNATKMFIDIVHDQLRNDLHMVYLDQQAKNN